jgi:ATP-dependent Lon protease
MNSSKTHGELCVIPLTQTVLFPGSETQIKVDVPAGELIKHRTDKDNDSAICLLMKKNHHTGQVTETDFHPIGTLVKIADSRKHSGGYRFDLLVQERVAVTHIKTENKLVLASYKILEDDLDMDEKSSAKMLEYMKEVTRDISKNFKGADPYVKIINSMESIPGLMGFLMPFLNISTKEKQSLLEIQSLRERGIAFMDYLLQQKESIKLQLEMAQKFSKEANDKYRKNFLQEQLKAIQKELNDGQTQGSGKKDYRELIDASHMPEDVRAAALEELGKLEAQGPENHESHVIRNYLDLLVSLPWESPSHKEIDLGSARDLLDQHHYGLDKVKERIVQHLAVMKLKNDRQGSILLLVGPPGTGKTSLGKSIAEALQRKYVRISLGGIRDEAEIRGHRRTYVGALPGRIIQGMKKAGEKNPVFVLDEVDKLVSAFHGDPASALLEVLDPEQNNTFSDHYLEVPYDLSEVFFVATANYLKGVPPPLLDRMEVIQISGYTGNEKFHIGKNHLIQQVLENHGLDDSQVAIEEQALKRIIDQYTLEAGVRGLRKQLTAVARHISEKIVTAADVGLPIIVDEEMVEDILGQQVARHDVAQLDNPPGVTTGLAWTPVGGDILFIEGTFMPGYGKLTLTGQLGDVMKESAKISLSLVRSRLAFNLPGFDFNKQDLHIHVPSGAMPKDGPSAGVALFTAVASLVMGRKIDPRLAMTGEITLRGSILPVGGIKEKVIAAQRAGITRVILPDENRKDLKDVPEEVKDTMTFIYIETIEDLIRETLDIELPKEKVVFGNPVETNLSYSI